MVILKRAGNKFIPLTFPEYEEERIRDGASPSEVKYEEEYFDKVINYCKSPDTAKLFSKEWN